MFRKKIEASCNAIDIAKTLVNRCIMRGYKIYSAKLERMMIIAYGEYLVKTGKRLFEEKIRINKSGIMIKEIHEKYGDYYDFTKYFNDDKVYLYSEERILRNIVDEYGPESFKYIDSDPRIKALKEFKRINRIISDKDIMEVFTSVSKRPIDTPILCSASEKAKWIINGCLQKGYDINTFKLEKLLILAYGKCLVKTGTKLFNENIVIWEAGAIIKEVDQDFRRYAMGFYAPLREYCLKLYSEEKLIDDIISTYGEMDGFKLNELGMLKELAQLKDGSGFVSDEDIKRVFKKYTFI